jgi:fructokinase
VLTAAFQQQFTHFSAQPVVSVDTTGAGDAFVAGLLASLAANGCHGSAALEPAIMQAQTCGALATTAKGR